MKPIKLEAHTHSWTRTGKELDDKKKKKKAKKESKMVSLKSLVEKKETGIDVAKRVVKNKQYEKGKGWAMDLTTAGFIMKVYAAYKDYPNLQRKMEKLPVNKMVNLAYKMIK